MDTRDCHGRFAKGSAGGPGRKPRPVEESYLEAVKKAMRHDDLVAVFKAILSKARKGDVAAARFITDYLIGRPADLETERRLAELEKML